MSLGALVAWALAKEIQRRGDRLPTVLLPTSQESPAHLAAHPAWTFTEATSDADVAAQLKASGFFTTVPDVLWENAAWCASFLRRTRAELQLEIDVAETRAAYADLPPLPCAVAAFLGTKDAVTEAQMAAWRDEAGGPFSFTPIPHGEHLMIQQPDVTGAYFPYLAKVLHDPTVFVPTPP